jgi:hypothetical protein
MTFDSSKLSFPGRARCWSLFGHRRHFAVPNWLSQFHGGSAEVFRAAAVPDSNGGGCDPLFNIDRVESVVSAWDAASADYPHFIMGV